MKQFSITENDSSQRLDKFLKKLLPNATGSLVYKFNRKNKVKVNGKREDNEYKLQIGDIVKVFLRDDEFEVLSKRKISDDTDFNKNGFDKKNIVYEDGDIIIVNKDPGINVHPGDHKTKETNLIYQLRDYLGDKLNSLTFKPSLVHRIDRDTSGALIVAKKKDILTRLVDDFKSHKKVKKVYYAIVYGQLPKETGVIDLKLKRIENAKNENKVQVNPSGQEAITNYRVIKKHNIKTKDSNILISELEVEILTGRMHQIRVHLSSIGNPILGDDKYGDKKINSYFKRNYNLTRQALHSWKIGFHHYTRNKNMMIEAKIKKDLTNFINSIK